MRSLAAPLVKLVAFATVTALATYVLAATIGNRGYGDDVSYRAEFTDVTGLVEGDDVRIAGVRVGQVTGIKVVRHSVAEISFTVRADRSLPTGTVASIRYRNLVGQMYVSLRQGPGPAGETLSEDGLIPVEQTEPPLDLTALFNGFQPLFQALNPADINKLSFEIVQVLQGEAGTVDSLLGHIASLTTTIAEKDAVIGRVITNLNDVLGTVSQRDTELANLITTLQRFVGGLAADRQAIGDSLVDIDALAGSTADLVDTIRPALADDIGHLRTVAGTLAAHRDVLDDYLTRLPDKLNTITRTASYGSWFNFYLCSIDGRVALPGVSITENLPVNLRIAVDEARCG